MRIHLTSLMAGLLLQDVTNQGLAAASTADSIAWGIGTVMLGVPTNINATVQVSSHKSDIAPIQILLGQIVTHPGGASTYNYVAKINTLCVNTGSSGTDKGIGSATCDGLTVSPSQTQNLPLTIFMAKREAGDFNNYFLCGSYDGTTCQYNSWAWNIGGGGSPAVIPGGIVLTQGVSYPFNFALPTTTVTAQPSTTFLSDAPGTATSAQSTSMTTVSTSPTTTRTIESPSATSPAAGNAVVSPKASSGGLSVGAKVGIAVGALGVLFLILLAALFFLRRAHKKKRAHNSEQVMLNRSIANDSRDLMAEKEAGHTSPSSFDAPVPVFAGGMGTGERPGSGGRHSALSPYEQIPSQPYSGSAAAVPRRKATASAPSNTQSRGLDSIPASEPLATGGLVSRGVSNASTNIVSPRSPVAPSSSDPSDRSHEFEEYHDVPVYGDARHVPQVFNGGLQAPFLAEGSENSLSSAEAARLAEEEEERRIDAAIAEAERAKGGGR